MPQDFPLISKDLLDRLREVFPDSLPADDDFTHREIDQAYGTQKVIRRLQLEYDRQNKLGSFQHVPLPKQGRSWGG